MILAGLERERGKKRGLGPGDGAHHEEHKRIGVKQKLRCMQSGAGFAMETAWMEYWKRPSGCVPGRVSKHVAKYPRPSWYSLGLNGGDGKTKGSDRVVTFASSKGAEYLVEFTFVPRPMEPNEVDKLVCCPPPEPCIVHDGIMFRDRLANSRRRSADVLGSMRETDHVEYYSTPPSRRYINRSSQEFVQPPALIAPDLVATKIVD